MDRGTRRVLTAVAVTAWSGVAGYGLFSATLQNDDNWSLPYALFNLALLVGAAVTVAVVAGSAHPAARPRLRLAGIGVCALGCLGSFVAWAFPLWMSLLAAGFALVTAAAEGSTRRALVLVTGAEVLGLAVLYGGLLATAGRSDGWVDAVWGASLMTVAAVTVVGLLQLAREQGLVPATPEVR